MSNVTIKPIETMYRGYRFRSRLEARWAVYFDAIGADWEYEPEGFDLGDGLYYLPDFVLHNMEVDTRTGGSGDQDVYVEVKGVMTEDDAEKIKRFANKSDRGWDIENPIYVVSAIPDPKRFIDEIDPYESHSGIYYHNYELLDGDDFGAYLCIGIDGCPGFFGQDSNYLRYADLGATREALKKARSARFDGYDEVKVEQKKIMERVMDIITEHDLTDFASLCYYLKNTGRHDCRVVQRLIGLERGPKSYEEWEQSVREKTKEEKQYLNLFAQQGIRPQQSYNVEYLPSVIDGILTETQTLEIVAPSKAGKTWLMLNLAQAVVTGGKFLGYQCKQGRVLYLCPELNSDTFTYRYCKICEGLPPEQSKPIFDYNGKQVSYEGVDDLFSLTKIGSQDTHDRPPVPTTLEELDKALSIFFKYNGHFKLVIIDPVYIFLDGDENSNTDVARFLSYFEVLAEKHRCAIAFSHHTAKGNTRDRQSIDMPAGAGSFGRKPDTILTLKEANVPDLEEDKNHEFFSAFYLEQRIRDAREPFKDFFIYRDGYGVYRRVPESMTHGAEVI